MSAFGPAGAYGPAPTPPESQISTPSYKSSSHRSLASWPSWGSLNSCVPSSIDHLEGSLFHALTNLSNAMQALARERASFSLADIDPSVIGFFDPSLACLDGTGVVDTSLGKIYTDALVWTDRLRHLSLRLGGDAMCTAWAGCLRGTALFWYSTELTPWDRERLAVSPITDVVATIINRFKPSTAEIRRRLLGRFFSIAHILHGYSPLVFLFEVLRDARMVGFTNEEALAMAYYHFDDRIRQTLRIPDARTTLRDMMNQLMNAWPTILAMAQKEWSDLYCGEA